MIKIPYLIDKWSIIT